MSFRADHLAATLAVILDAVVQFAATLALILIGLGLLDIQTEGLAAICAIAFGSSGVRRSANGRSNGHPKP